MRILYLDIIDQFVILQFQFWFFPLKLFHISSLVWAVQAIKVSSKYYIFEFFKQLNIKNFYFIMDILHVFF